MSIFLFQNAISQYIDESGKTRMIHYDISGTKLSLMTSPIPPLDLPNEKEIFESPLKEALKFIKERNLVIAYQDGNEEDGIQGLWVEMKENNAGIYYGYIPTEISSYLKNVEFSEPTKNDPIRVDSVISDLQAFKKSRRIADYLKQYTLYTYALNPEKFGKNSFKIRPDHEYDIQKLNKKLFMKDNDVMYEGEQLIVPSKSLRDNLIKYLNSELLNDTPGVLSLAEKVSVEDYYKSVADFRVAPNQLIFSSSTGVLRWKNNLRRRETSSKVSQNLLPDTTEPYFYKSPGIKSGVLFIVQNVESGSMEDAAIVSYKWTKDRVNVGYKKQLVSTPTKISTIVYTNEGVLNKEKGENLAPILFYDNGTYGAILFLN